MFSRKPVNRRVRHSRAAFLKRAAGALGAATLWPERFVEAASTAAGSRNSRSVSKVQRWVVVTIGNLSRNRYWGESDEKGVRPAICTCTLIEGAGFRLLVDPSLEQAEAMARELDRRTGLRLEDVTAVFITHEHGDHYAGLAHFPQARWFASPEVAALLNRTKKWPKAMEPAAGTLYETLQVVPTPGHTLGLNSLIFKWQGHSIAVVGDAVATEEFWRERRGYFNCVDFKLSAQSMDKLAKLAEVIVPGHDNYFLAESQLRGA